MREKYPPRQEGNSFPDAGIKVTGKSKIYTNINIVVKAS
jgi:hypothetical protein